DEEIKKRQKSILNFFDVLAETENGMLVGEITCYNIFLDTLRLKLEEYLRIKKVSHCEAFLFHLTPPN
ncbi:hypothetical protein, partial [Staphylococcus pseudintermedius]|uniref:hypothetical protein n=1 Tax=Staphylococcus pseudintermedius TaxID=283734 RepID=UPI001EE6EBD9